MIYTVTFNPAIDYIAQVNNLYINGINRTISEKILPGGKGINVSIVLKNLGIDSMALGFTAGFTGKEIERQIQKVRNKNRFCICTRQIFKNKYKTSIKYNGRSIRRNSN